VPTIYSSYYYYYCYYKLYGYQIAKSTSHSNDGVKNSVTERLQPSSATSIKYVQQQIPSLVERRVSEINIAVTIDIEVIHEIQWMTIYVDARWKQKMCVTCITHF